MVIQVIQQGRITRANIERVTAQDRKALHAPYLHCDRLNEIGLAWGTALDLSSIRHGDLWRRGWL